MRKITEILDANISDYQEYVSDAQNKGQTPNNQDELRQVTFVTWNGYLMHVNSKAKEFIKKQKTVQEQLKSYRTELSVLQIFENDFIKTLAQGNDAKKILLALKQLATHANYPAAAEKLAQLLDLASRLENKSDDLCQIVFKLTDDNKEQKNSNSKNLDLVTAKTLKKNLFKKIMQLFSENQLDNLLENICSACKAYPNAGLLLEKLSIKFFIYKMEDLQQQANFNEMTQFLESTTQILVLSAFYWGSAKLLEANHYYFLGEKLKSEKNYPNATEHFKISRERFMQAKDHLKIAKTQLIKKAVSPFNPAAYQEKIEAALSQITEKTLTPELALTPSITRTTNTFELKSSATDQAMQLANGPTNCTSTIFTANNSTLKYTSEKENPNLYHDPKDPKNLTF